MGHVRVSSFWLLVKYWGLDKQTFINNALIETRQELRRHHLLSQLAIPIYE